MTISEKAAKRQGLDRRDFLRTGTGMAAALLALNQVFGDCYDVERRGGRGPEGVRGEVAQGPVHLRHPDAPRRCRQEVVRRHAARASAIAALLPDAAAAGRTLEKSLDQLNRAHYVKEVFGDSDTVMAVISGVPTREWDKNPLPPDQMVATRKYVNDLAGSQRVLSHGLLRPNLGEKELDEMERQVKDLKIDAWKMYTGAELGEKAVVPRRREGGVPVLGADEEARRQERLRPQGAAARLLQREGVHAARPGEGGEGLAGPELHHLPLRLSAGFGAIGRGTGEKVEDKKTDDPQEIPWISDILRILKKNPKIKNIYFELGSTFNMLSAAQPDDVPAHARADDPGRPGRTTSCGAPTRSGTAARRARSTGCAG